MRNKQMEHTTKNATANNTRHMDVHGHKVTLVFSAFHALLFRSKSHPTFKM